jgi:hypothetical protein
MMKFTILASIATHASGAAFRAEHLSLIQNEASLQKTKSQQATADATWAQTALFTMHGCECAENWHLDGLALHGCVHPDGHDLPWCFVKDDAACSTGYAKDNTLPGNCSTDKTAWGRCDNATGCHAASEERTGKWDFCALQEDVDSHYTHNGCHCLPSWEHGRKIYSGCSEPDGADGTNASAWCYVAEANCSGAKAAAAAKKQKWDECDLPRNTPSYVTRHSCHCKPTWIHEGDTKTSCVRNGLLDPPAELTYVNHTLERESLYGWCHVFEDERGCAGATIVDGTHVDTCFMLDDATATELVRTLHGCHCLPEWVVDDVVYAGCSRPPSPDVEHYHDVEEEQAWCRIAEDAVTCADSLGPEEVTPRGAGRGQGRWDWCTITTHSEAEPEWRHSEERFTPQEPDPPQWFRDFEVQAGAGMNDLDAP